MSSAGTLRANRSSGRTRKRRNGSAATHPPAPRERLRAELTWSSRLVEAYHADRRVAAISRPSRDSARGARTWYTISSSGSRQTRPRRRWRSRRTKLAGGYFAKAKKFMRGPTTSRDPVRSLANSHRGRALLLPARGVPGQEPRGALAWMAEQTTQARPQLDQWNAEYGWPSDGSTRRGGPKLRARKQFE